MTGIEPVEPPPSPYTFPEPRQWGSEDCVAVGGGMDAGTVLGAYRRGLFPMHLPDGRLGWWSPVRRGVIPLDALRVSRSLRRSVGRYEVTVDGAFDQVVEGCADPTRPGGWITDEIQTAYATLHEMGWAHSVETWSARRLVGGFYGVAIGGAFFGESMFHVARDASKVALVRFVEAFRGSGGLLLDVQWATDHLTSLGAVGMSRADYLVALARALDAPRLSIWSRSSPLAAE